VSGPFPVVEPPFDGDSATVSVAGVLLAAGTSSRFGDANKLLHALDGEPLVRRAARPLLAGSLDEVVVVVGHEADAVRSVLADLPVQLVENPSYDAGQATSVRAGVRAVESRDAAEPAGRADRTAPDGILFALGDMPDVSPETIETLVAAFAAGAGDPLVAAYEGTRGNPVLFGHQFVERLSDLQGDTGGRTILRDAANATLVETGDPGVRRDVDTPGDL
jgi:molybdenum cofactor cytidylyltransferase